MNIWQRITILLGSIIIMIIFTASPHKYEKEVVYHPNPNSKTEKYRIEQFIDYKITALEGLGVAIFTAGVVVILGAAKKKKET